jgi:putative transposase
MSPSSRRPRSRSLTRPRVEEFEVAAGGPEFPAKGFADLDQARRWAVAFVHWYNFDHRHGDIRYISPAQRHAVKTEVAALFWTENWAEISG